MSNPRFSFILPAHNEEALVGRAVWSVRHAAEAIGESFEIVVVNDASTDATAGVARANGARVIDVNLRQIAAVRNAGARAARGEWLVFMDADTWMTPPVLAAIRRALRGGAIGGGAAARFDGVVPLYARILLPLCVRLLRWLRTASGCLMFATRPAFDAIGGFDETLFASEEVAFSRAMKQRGRFVIVREKVTTSGRKLRDYPARVLFGVLLRQSWLGRDRAFKSRTGLDIWYNAPRERAT